MSRPSAAELVDRLRTIPEPCSLLMRTPVDIYEMGIVGPVSCGESGEVEVELVLTDPSCIHFSSLQRYITDALLDVAGVTAVSVTASTTLLWTPDRQRTNREEPA